MPSTKLSEGIDLEEDLKGSLIQDLRSLGKPHVFAPNEYLYRQDAVARHVFVLLEGTVKATSTHVQGFDTLLKIHGPGSLLGLSALRQNGLRDANGIAVSEAKTLAFSSSKFLDILDNNGPLGMVLIRVLLKRQQELHTRIRDLLGYSVEQRLAEALLQLARNAALQSGGEGFPEIHITHEDLASLVISRRQYITQILRSFAEKKLIATGHKRIRILNPSGLSAIIGG